MARQEHINVFEIFKSFVLIKGQLRDTYSHVVASIAAVESFGSVNIHQLHFILPHIDDDFIIICDQ